MDGIYLTGREKRLLFLMRFKKKVKPRFDVSMLVSVGLISPNRSGVKNSIGEYLMDGSYSLTDKYTRFRIAKRQDLFRRLVTPITVTVLTNIVLYGLQWLIKWLQSLS